MGTSGNPFPKSPLAFPHHIWDLVTRPSVPLLKPMPTPANIMSSTLHCDVTILSITSADMDVTAVGENLLTLLCNLRHLVIYLTLPKVAPFAHTSDPDHENGYLDFRPLSYNHLWYHLRAAHNRLQTLVINYDEKLSAELNIPIVHLRTTSSTLLSRTIPEHSTDYSYQQRPVEALST